MTLMRYTLAILTLLPLAAFAQAPAAGETSRSIAGGGISVAGWAGKVDASEASQGKTVNDAKFEKQGDKFHVVTGPAITYWQTDKKATGNYTVSATFTEPKYMNLNTHPHPYGIMIGDNNGANLYCAAYGNGNFIVRGFGPDAFQMNGRRGEMNAAVHKAADKGQPVTQDIAMSVKGDKVECSINGAVVASYPKSDVVTSGKLTSIDGNYGLRFAHNTEVEVTNFKVTH